MRYYPITHILIKYSVFSRTKYKLRIMNSLLYIGTHTNGGIQKSRRMASEAVKQHFVK